ncbi:MAG: hypothetical protein HUU16_06890 [Candidatus Omnitrophica bacterium]|nr:hypothetical protein [Candidatus Omnitrophota bacterium]
MDPSLERLRVLLVRELREGKPDREPTIIIEQTGPGGPVHLYVIWSEWGELPVEDRAMVILKAYEEVEGTDKALEVTLALGLRAEEAPRFGIELTDLVGA